MGLRDLVEVICWARDCGVFIPSLVVLDVLEIGKVTCFWFHQTRCAGDRMGIPEYTHIHI